MLSIFFIDNSLNERIGNINNCYIPVFLCINWKDTAIKAI